MFFIKRAFLFLQIILGASSLLFFTSFKTNSLDQIEKKIFIPQSHLEQSRYFYVPFEVPKGANRIAVSYDYNSLGGTNVVDIGIFDARFSGTDTDPKGFRGWSGGKRSEFFIAKDDSTPGYLAGDLTAGTWRIILGLYKVAPQGVEVSIRIKILAADADKLPVTAEFPPPPPPRPKERAPGWYRGDLHLHTLHSDGDWTLPRLLENAQSSGLDFVGVTEHNTPTHHFEIDEIAMFYRPMLVMRGEEVTTYGGHFNVWGLPSGEWIDFRVRGGDSQSIARLVDQTHKSGALASINHPFAPCFGCDWSYDFEKTNFDSIEVWNGAWDITDEAALKRWDALLQKGVRLTAVGSSDFHRPPALVGLPTTHVGATNLNQKEILGAVKSGRVFVTEKPTQSLELSVSNRTQIVKTGETVETSDNRTVKVNTNLNGFPENSVAALIHNGEVSVKATVTKDITALIKTVKIEKDSYFRLEVRDADGKMLGFTNPIFVKLNK